MTLKIILIVDEDEAEQLVGVLAKGLGRGEMGIREIRIDRSEEMKTIAKPAVAKRAKDVDDLIKRLPTTPRRYAAVGKSLHQVMYDFIVSHGSATWLEFKAELVKHGFAPNSIGMGMRRLQEVHPEVVKSGCKRGAPYVLRTP
jgi:hypothetical protein